MSFPGISASGEDLERWLDETIEQRQACGAMAQRWWAVDATTPSGKSLYECRGCGRLSASCALKCWPLVGDKGKWR